jgi:hypothetical protein
VVVFGAPSTPFLLANNTVLAIGIIGAANLWVQSGMNARHVAVLGAALVAYDFVATSVLPLMNDLIDRLASLPFALQITWASGDNQWLGIGLGDLLMATVFPLVMRKAFGRTAGLLALVSGLVTLKMLPGFSGSMSEFVVVVRISIGEGTADLAENVSW